MSRNRLLLLGGVAIIAGGAVLAFVTGRTATIVGTAIALAGATLIFLGWGRADESG